MNVRKKDEGNVHSPHPFFGNLFFQPFAQDLLITYIDNPSPVRYNLTALTQDNALKRGRFFVPK